MKYRNTSLEKVSLEKYLSAQLEDIDQKLFYPINCVDSLLPCAKKAIFAHRVDNLPLQTVETHDEHPFSGQSG